MLVHGTQTPTTAHLYKRLPFKSTCFNDVFEDTALDFPPEPQFTYPIPVDENLNLAASSENSYVDLSRTISHSSSSSMSVPLNPSAPSFVKTAPPAPPPTKVATVLDKRPAQAGNVKAHLSAKTGIPVNKLGQRVDLPIPKPSHADLMRFEDRIYQQKLCNEHHLRDNCWSTPCKFDHNPIDDGILNALRIKARSIPCREGSKCRRLDCFMGHMCPVSSSSDVSLS